MPFSRLYRRQAPFADPDNYDSNMPYNLHDQWHEQPEQEMDFTTYSNLNQTTQLPEPNNTTSMDINDSPTYLRPDSIKRTTDKFNAEMFDTGPFSYPDIINMDSNTVSPLDISSSSSVRTDSVAGIECGYSPSLGASSNALPTFQEKMCPLISGDTDVCEPSRCGPDAPCMNFTTLAPIEECTSVPCINPPTSASPPETRASTRARRPLTTKRSNTQMSTSTSSSVEEKARVAPPTRRANQRGPARNTSAERPTAVTKLDKKQRAKQAHSLVEKKYRENLNTKLLLLHTTLHNAQYGPRRYNDADSDIDLDDDFDGEGDNIVSRVLARGAAANAGSNVSAKFRKSEVMDDAMNYVNQTEVEMRHMEAEIMRLSDRVKTLEKLVKCEDCSLLKRMVHLQVQTT